VVKEIITEILKKVIQDGKGIEVNTSSHRYGLKDLTPSRAISKLCKELGRQGNNHPQRQPGKAPLGGIYRRYQVGIEGVGL